MASRPLAGCRVAITREQPGRLAALLHEAGAEVVHVPLIEVVDPVDDGAALRDALTEPERPDWVLVTSPEGAGRVIALAASDLAAGRLSVGCVGTATAAVVEQAIGRPVDLVPARQTGLDLAAAFAERHVGAEPRRVVVAQADRASSDLVDHLHDAGHHVRTVVAYRTLVRTPDPTERDLLASTDVLLLASGSAAQGWVDAFGPDATSALPSSVVAIGPSTAAVARGLGLKIDAVAADHSLQGLVRSAILVWRDAPRENGDDATVADSSAGTPDRRDPPAGG